MVKVLLSWPESVSSGVVPRSYATLGTVGVQIHGVGTCKHVQRSKLRHCVAAVRCYANYTGLVGFPQRLEPQNQPTPNQSVPIKPSKPLRENFCWKLFLY